MDRSAASAVRLATCDKLAEAFDKMDVPAMLALRTPDCQHLFAPESCNIGPPRGNAHFAGYMRTIKPIIRSIHWTPKDIIEDEKRNMVMSWGTNTVCWTDAARAGLGKGEPDFEVEMMFIMTLDESGEKLERIVEFFDSKVQEVLNAKILKAKEYVQKLRMAQMGTN